jgi:hypothetical protein
MLCLSAYSHIEIICWNSVNWLGLLHRKSLLSIDIYLLILNPYLIFLPFSTVHFLKLISLLLTLILLLNLAHTFCHFTPLSADGVSTMTALSVHTLCDLDPVPASLLN